MTQETKSRREMLLEMKVGQELTFPIGKCQSVRSLINQMKFRRECEAGSYTTRQDLERGTVTVLRVK